MEDGSHRGTLARSKWSPRIADSAEYSEPPERKAPGLVMSSPLCGAKPHGKMLVGIPVAHGQASGRSDPGGWADVQHPTIKPRLLLRHGGGPRVHSRGRPRSDEAVAAPPGFSGRSDCLSCPPWRRDGRLAGGGALPHPVAPNRLGNRGPVRERHLPRATRSATLSAASHADFPGEHRLLRGQPPCILSAG